MSEDRSPDRGVCPSARWNHTSRLGYIFILPPSFLLFKHGCLFTVQSAGRVRAQLLGMVFLRTVSVTQLFFLGEANISLTSTSIFFFICHRSSSRQFMTLWPQILHLHPHPERFRQLRFITPDHYNGMALISYWVHLSSAAFSHSSSSSLVRLTPV